MTEPAISVEGASKRFRLERDRPTSLKESFTSLRRTRAEEFWALRDVSLEVPAGQMLGLIGRNGSGKSSLLRLMAGIYRPTEGRVRSAGRVSALLELGAGFHPDLTGRENIFLNASILGVPRSLIAERVEHIIEFSGLEQFIDSPVKVYSSGMYVRLGFAVAVHVDPEILILDEVVAVGDKEFQQRCFQHLRQLKQRGVTIVLASHDLNVVKSLSDSVAWLDGGRLAGSGDPVDVVRAYMADMEEQQPALLDPSGKQPLERENPRIRITDVRFLDAAGRESRNFASGDPLVVRIHYHASEPVTDPVFSLGFYDRGSLHLSGPRSHAGGFRAGRLAGEGCVEFRIAELPFRVGAYYVNVAVQDTGLTVHYDHSVREYWLRVVAENDQGARGLLDLGSDWRAVP